MNIYITKLNGANRRETAQYMQIQTAKIAHQFGCREMGIYHYNANAENPESRISRLDGIIAGICAGDIVVCQFPTWNGLKFDRALVDRIIAYHGNVAIFIHDVPSLMFESDRYLMPEIADLYNQAEVLVAPSYAMKEFLLENGVRANMKFVVQEIWDFTTDIDFMDSPRLKKEIHFAGDLGRFLFPHEWDYDIPLKLYSDKICTGKTVQCMGWMNPTALLLELAKGGFGLMWYGDEYMHQYMKYNNNTKMSAYLAAGIPVIVPFGISNQYLIEGIHLGIVGESLEEAVEKVRSITEQEYQEYVSHVGKFAALLRNGYFTRKLLTEVIHRVSREDVV